MGLFRSSTAKRSFKLRVSGLGRVFLYSTFLMTAGGLLHVRHARAEFEDQSLEFGRQMFELAKATNHEVTTIVFNGQKLRVGTSGSDATPSEVLERYEEYCRANAADGETALDPAAAKEGEKGAALRVGGPKANREDGVILCFTKGTNKVDRDDAFETFVKTGELGALGEVRYAYVSKDSEGKTLVLTVWTDSKFNLLDIAPKDASTDVRGSDFAEIPRLPESVRTLSAYAEGTPYGANVYRTAEAPSKVVEFYDREMQARGWFMYDPELDEKKDGGIGRGYLKDGVVLTVNAHVDEGSTYATLGMAGVSSDDRLGRR